MPEIGPEHPITYRQELLTPLFQLIRARESCAIIGVASMGKSRLLQFMARQDVRRHYLASQVETTLLIGVDCNRIARFSTWGLHELILTALVEVCGEYAQLGKQRTRLSQLRQQAIIARNGLLAQRHVELALQMICKEQGLHICFLLDEFDEAYRSLPGQALVSLRALRDLHKYQVSYVLFTRDHPLHLRPPDECEGFFELISRSILGLKPYRDEDMRRIIDQIRVRRSHELTQLNADMIQPLLVLCGGHPGLLVALLNALTVAGPIGVSWLEWAQDQADVGEECRKIWEGLRGEERQSLHHLAHNLDIKFQTREVLVLKGLVDENRSPQTTFFSPIFAHYAAHQMPVAGDTLQIDTQAGSVWVSGKQCQLLTGKEYDLLLFLYEHLGDICSVEQIVNHLYQGREAFNINDSTIAAIVKRVREKVEPNPKRPQYLLNIKGRGYKLISKAESL